MEGKEGVWKYIDETKNIENIIHSRYCDSIIKTSSSDIYEYIIKLNNNILYTLNRVSLSSLSEYNLTNSDICAIISACREKCKLERKSIVYFEKLIGGEKSHYIKKYMEDNNMLNSGKKKLIGK